MSILPVTKYSSSSKTESSPDEDLETVQPRNKPRENYPAWTQDTKQKLQIPIRATTNEEKSESYRLFEKVWSLSTEDNNLALYGFRRFKTMHLLNLRLLEEEIDRIDHRIYQAGLKLGIDPSSSDRLGLKYCQKEEHALRSEEIVNEELISELRELLRQYDDGLAGFNRIMTMETCSMIDDQRRFNLRTDFSLPEIYKARLVRVDLGPRTLQDPFQRCLHKCLRWFRYRKLSRNLPTQSDMEVGAAPTHRNKTTHKSSYQNTVGIADMVWRVLVALLANIFIVAPLAILSYQSNRGIQLIIVSIWVVVFSFLTSIFFKASNQATVAAIAAYAAVLSVFISNSPI